MAAANLEGARHHAHRQPVSRRRRVRNCRGGIRREPEIPAHEDIAPAQPVIRNEFAFYDGDRDDEDTAARNRHLAGQVQDNARRAALDPGDGIDL